MTNINGRTAFITGGGNGIGLGIARSLAKVGVKLALVDLDADALVRAKDELKDITSVEIFQLDVTDREAYKVVADTVEKVLGSVSLLFNNAGVAGADSVKNLTYDLWDWYIGINLYGVINGVQTFLPRMIENGLGGHIVNTASGAGLAATGAGLYYTTSKYAVVGLSEELKLELASTDIGVSVLCPGPVATGILRRSVESAPKGGVQLSDDHERQIKEQIDKTSRMLQQHGVSINDVGEMVLQAIYEKSLYIHTDRSVEELIKNRTKALLKALPVEQEE